ncbi:MAG: transporter ATP-binding protein [Acidimicrobiales bacterium]|nr:transporter ATP-binding protein [Acidimicrobiales bacterium]
MSGALGTIDAAPVIEISGVVKHWGSVPALAGATCTIRRGVTGLLGANGAGKTTLLGMILGLHSPDAGQLKVFGMDPATAGPDVRAHVGYSPEHHLLPPDVKAVDFVRHVAEVHGLPHREATNRASDMLWQVGLGEERGRPMGTMSTGQRQRVKLAQALAHDPSLVLLDEPTDGLDPVQRDAMLELIHRIGNEFGISVLLSSHLLEEVERICDDAVILSAGVVAAAGPLDALRGSSEGLAVEFEGDQAAIDAALTAVYATGAQIRIEGRGYVITGDERLFDIVRDAIADAGAPLRRLGRRTVSLEEVFLGVGAAADPAVDPRRLAAAQLAARAASESPSGPPPPPPPSPPSASPPPPPPSVSVAGGPT